MGRAQIPMPGQRRVSDPARTSGLSTLESLSTMKILRRAAYHQHLRVRVR